MSKKKKVRTIAFYLPQFHPIPENDKWWGKGFTEWTNVGKAKKLFRGHYQPRVPADLGYYDLRMSEARKAQADMARNYGIEGFCYWHYWFGNGKRLIETPFSEVVSSGEPDFPFCLAWANDTWQAKLWNSEGTTVNYTLQEQLYPGDEDYIAHFMTLLSAFKDDRYIKVNDKPLFMIYKPFDVPDMKGFIGLWQRLAVENGLAGIYFVAQTTEIDKVDVILEKGFDAVNILRLYDYPSQGRSFIKKVIHYIRRKALKRPFVYRYKDAMKYFVGQEEANNNIIPSIIPNWDHTPRSGLGGLVYTDSNPELFREHVKVVFEKLKNKPSEERIAFIKSWNEWAEGNYIEPDLVYGKQYLEVLLSENIEE
jgi:hypothetical protein